MRTFLSMALIVLLTVLTPLSAIAAWSDLEIGDADRFVSVMAPLASNPDVRRAITDRITAEGMKQIDAGDLQDEVRDLLHDAVLSFTTTEAFRGLWNTVTRAAHTTGERVLASDRGTSVEIDLAPITRQVKEQLLSERVPMADRIPVRHTEITVLRPDGLGVWRDVVVGLRTAGIWPAVATLLLTGAAVMVAVHRRRALIAVGLAFAVGGVLLAVAVLVGRRISLGDLPAVVDRSAAAAVYDALTASLFLTAGVVIGVGLVFTLVVTVIAFLRGKPGDSAQPTP